MGGSRHTDLSSEYLHHTQNTSYAHSTRRQSSDQPTAQEPSPGFLWSLPNRSQSQSSIALLNPLLNLVHLNNLHQKSSPNCQSPTVIVSPHLESPTLEWDHTRNAPKKHPVKWRQSRQKLDGNNTSPPTIHSGTSPMTSGDTVAMGSIREEGCPYPLATRPSMVSHHSSSVPSTPHQYPREFASRSRSPSPNGGLGSHSPRSVSSEANGLLPTLRKPRPGCRFETNVAFGRRRIPYTSSDPLEKAKDEPKTALDPHEEEKLSGDMRELYNRLLPTEESQKRRDDFVKKLENILHGEWPGNEFKVHVFGSSGNLLCTSESDVDVCIQTPMKKLESMHMLAEALAKHGMEKVVCVPSAKVPIVKIWDPELRLACDMNVNNTLALENTRMIKTYVQIDERVRPLAMIIKYWTKQRILNDAALGGTISSYTWICMILNFLQTRKPPILPALHQMPRGKVSKENGTQSDFADDLDALQGFGKDNKETLGELLFNFFRRYGHEMDYENYVISVRHGRLLSRKEKGWDLDSLTREGRDRLCVEEPFNTFRNLGNSADDFAFRGIHLEIRQAFDFLADGGQLEKACEQYEFPPEEKIVFKKPTPAPKPILTQSSASSGRGGRGGSGHRGGRGNFNQKGNHSYGRRASSGASFGNNRSPFLHSPPIGVGGPDYFRGLNDQLHDQLYQQYQLLEMQSNSLKAQLLAQHRAQQQAQQLHAQAVAQAQAQAQGRGQTANGSPQKSPYVTGRSSPRMPDSMPATAPAVQGFLYHYPAYYDPTQVMVPSISQDGSRTNPSSPSLANSIPGLRRGVHRSSTASDTAGASIRSQSQPARTASNTVIVQGYPPQYLDPTAVAGYPIARSTQDMPPPYSTMESPYSPISIFPESAVSSDHGTPKEYVGYYVDDSPQIRPQYHDYSVPPIPSYNELAQRRRRISPDLMQPLLNTTLRRVSRSPSPSPLGGHLRSHSIAVTPGSSLKPQPRKDRIDSTQATEDDGLVIVNGSYPSKPRESRAMSESVDMLPNGGTNVNDPSALGIYMPSVDQYHMAMSEQRQQQLYADELLQRHNAAELMRSGMANGIVNNTSPIEANGLSRVPSGPRQVFPQLPEPIVNHYATVNGDGASHSTEVSPTRAQQQWRANQLPNGVNPLDTTKAPRAPPQEIKSAGLPLLSPVFETRTPSPTISRQMDLNKSYPVNGTSVENKDNQQLLQSRPAPASKESTKENQTRKNTISSDKSTRASPSGPNQPSTWQPSNQKRRNNKKTKSAANHKSVSEPRSQGEPLPANEADRKGG
ncbi:hypothetical protein AOQ84DRAFT_116404 [Glonium stellatum]|uniref:polynucleotide adenylyltransferase n=1 Tax=Glonium stellatum TaxID=574774 RepID=A0A8E2JP75_9PEZI|nr:hypothetical protein AOQ84DRAFT_116404 [Glonium stellatum]